MNNSNRHESFKQDIEKLEAQIKRENVILSTLAGFVAFLYVLVVFAG